MFDSIGWGEIVVITLAALFIFGPDRLPSMAKDAVTALRRTRAALTDLRGQVDEALGDDLAELRAVDLRHYTPRNLIGEQLLRDDTGPSLR